MATDPNQVTQAIRLLLKALEGDDEGVTLRMNRDVRHAVVVILESMIENHTFFDQQFEAEDVTARTGPW